MRQNYRTFVQAVALGVALGQTPALAQDDGADIQTLIELAGNDSAQDIVALPGAELAAILDAASQAERRALVSELPDEEIDALMTTLAQDAADPVLIGQMVSAVISEGPDATDRIIELVLLNTAPSRLPPIAAELYDVIDREFAELSLAVFDGHVLAALTFDSDLAGPLVELGNTWDEANAARLARALSLIAEQDDGALASAIETALAIEGGQMIRLASEFREELPVAATPEAPAPAPPATPAVPPAGIGGGGASPGGTLATTPGLDALFAAGNTPGTGLGAGPAFTPAPTPFVVSPTN